MAGLSETEGRAAAYSSRADDESGSTKSREASMLYSIAEEHLNNDAADDCWSSASEALIAFRELGDDRSVAETVRLLAGCLRLKEDLKAAEAMAWTELELFQELGSEWGEAAMLLTLTEINADRRGSKKRKMALDSGLEARAMFQDLGDSSMEAAVLLALISVYDKSAKWDDALKAGNEALAIYRSLGDRTGEGKALHGLSIAHGMVRRCGDAIKMGRKALAIFQEEGVRKLEAEEYVAIGKWCMLDQDWKQMLDVGNSAREIYAQLKDADGQQNALGLIVEASANLGSRDEALSAAEKCLDDCEAAGDRKGQATVYEMIARAFVGLQDLPEACSAFEKALEIVQGFGSKKWESRIVHKLAELYLQMGAISKAHAKAHEAIEMFQLMQVGKMEAATKLHVLLNVQAAYGQHDEAIATAKEALQYYRNAGEEKGEGVALLLLGQMYGIRGQNDLALTTLRQAQELMRDAGERRVEAQICKSVADIHLENGRTEEATRLAHEAQALANRAKDRNMEVSVSIFVCQCHQKMMEKMSSPDRKSLAFKSEWEKAMKAANTAKTVARKIEDKQGLAEALYTCADVLIIQGNVKDATTALDESLALYRECKSATGEVQALVLSGNIAFLRHEKSNATAFAMQALEIAKRSGDKKSIDSAQGLVKMLEDDTAATAPRAAAVAEGSHDSEGPAEVTPAAASSATAATGPVEEKPRALDREVVSDTLQDMMVTLIGADVEADTPFMDAGLDSLLAIQFRQELVNTFQGLGLSSTITFDYPTARSLVDHVVEKSVEAIADS